MTHRRLTPYLLLAPGIAFLAVFFVVPLYYLANTSLQTGSIDVGYSLTWAWGNYSDALSTYRPQFIRSIQYAALATFFALVIGYPLAYFIAVGRQVEELPAAPGHRAVLRHVPDPHAGLADDPGRRGHGHGRAARRSA